ncbi:MAG: recombinase family protein [Polyangiaceae bacterium]|nr:recombinase family protein [Polyangiaceae bacterium]
MTTRAALYVRRSREEHQHASIDVQIDQGSAFIAERGWETDPTLIFVEREKEASRAEFVKRPALIAMLEAAKRGEFQILVVRDETRLGGDMLRVGLLSKTFALRAFASSTTSRAKRSSSTTRRRSSSSPSRTTPRSLSARRSRSGRTSICSRRLVLVASSGAACTATRTCPSCPAIAVLGSSTRSTTLRPRSFGRSTSAVLKAKGSARSPRTLNDRSFLLVRATAEAAQVVCCRGHHREQRALPAG